MSLDPRRTALLFRVARIIAEVRTVRPKGTELSELLEQLDAALADLDDAMPGWRDRTPLWRSTNERKGRRS